MYYPARDILINIERNILEKEDCMYTLIRSVSLRHFVMEQIPALGLSVIVAETFYKFHSFTLECLAFLATWFVLDAVVTTLANLVKKPSAISHTKV